MRCLPSLYLEDQNEKPRMEETPIIKEFSDMFLDDIPSYLQREMLTLQLN